MYEKSFSVLTKIDGSYFTSIQQSYRIAEILEVTMCDRLYLQPEQVSVQEFAEFCEDLTALADLSAREIEMDVTTAAVPPYALARCVDSMFQKEHLRQKADQLFDSILDLLVRTGQDEHVGRVVERVRTRLASRSSLSGSPSKSC